MGGFLRSALTVEEAAFLDRAAAFTANTVAQHANEWERARRQPVEALREAASLGLLRLETPKEQGGLGHRYLVKLALCEEMSRADMAFTFSMVNTQNVAARLAVSPVAQHREEHVPALMSGALFGATALSEPGAGSDFSSIRTSAQKVEGGWRLDGEKGWITNAAIADLFITYVQTDVSAGWRGIACFLVDARKPGFTRCPAYDLMGGHAIGAGGFMLENYLASDEDMIAPQGEAFKLAMKGVNGARVYVAAMCVGMLGHALETALAYGAERRAFGKSLLEHQGLNWSLGDVANDLEALRGLVAHAGHLIDREEDAVMAAAHAKKFAGRVTLPRLADCIQSMGAAGVREEYGLHRHLACAKIAAYTDGSTEMMNERIGAGLLKAHGPAA